ncbi:DGQHR domain-containing protein [Brevibacillus formosus]|nr:DGQHR domain-containing protein [Brevibacillus formosus]
MSSIQTNFGTIKFYTQNMKVKDLVYVHYVAVRGKDEEEGAVQRVLSKQRINSIKDFVLKGNMFVSTFILNWTDEKKKPYFNNSNITIPIISSAAQVIDGQHRIAGLQEAMKEDDSVGEKEVIVSLCIGLTTKEAASIFLNINSQQKPVPKSLIFDLYGIVEDNEDHSITRAKDIAIELNDNISSPYYKCIKFPGMPRGAGIIDLSTVVSSLRKSLEPDGVFSNYKLKDLNLQKQVILNYLTAIKYFYEEEGMWANKAKNPFLQNAGFFGAIDSLTSEFILKCANKKSFTVETFKQLLSLNNTDLLYQRDIKNLDGKTARARVREFLETYLKQTLPEQDEYEFE